MKIIEQFIEGKKGDPQLCEDRLVVTPNFIALLDGATSRLGQTLGGEAFGVFAVKALEQGLNVLNASASGREAVSFLSEHLRHAYLEQARKEGQDLGTGPYPAAALLVYSSARREIWRVADSSFFANGKANETTFKLEDAEAKLRHIMIEGKKLRGITEADLQEHDPFQDIMKTLTKDMRAFVNQPHEFGFGVMDGTFVPDCHVEIFPVPDAPEVSFASDGYPRIFATWKETEDYLQDVLRRDPLMYKIHPQVKGVGKGMVSYDDRSYIRFST